MSYKRYLIGEHFFNNKGFRYEIVGYCNEYVNNHKKRVVRFDSGYECVVNTPNILTGNIVDYGRPTVLGIGYGCKSVGNRNLYTRWYKMLSRCYDSSSHNYKWYGLKVVYVCDRWLRYENYEKDIMSMDNYNYLESSPSLWNIDKDIVRKGNKCYCKEMCKIVRKCENVHETINRNKNTSAVVMKKVVQMDKNFNIINHYDSMKIASVATGIKASNISACCRGKCKTSGGFIWKYHRDS